MVIALWSFANLAQEFEIPVTAIPGVPDNVVQAALGGPHRVVVPQRQRLLVAANKATEASKEAAGTAAPNTGTKASPRLLQSLKRAQKQRQQAPQKPKRKGHRMQTRSIISSERRSLPRSSSESKSGTFNNGILEHVKSAYQPRLPPMTFAERQHRQGIQDHAFQYRRAR